MRRFPLALLLAAAALAAPATAHAAQSAALDVSAELLNQPAGRPWSINLGIGVDVTTPDGGPPSPLKTVDIRFPQGATVNADRFASCTVAQLERDGRGACPKASLVGGGSAKADVRPLLPDLIGADVKVYVGPDRGRHQTLLFSAVTSAPVHIHLVMEGLLRRTKGRYGYRLTFEIPPINTVPGAAPAAVSHFDAVVGGKRRGRSFIEAPRRCPRRGLPFAGRFGYADGSRSRTTATISCTLRSTRG